MLATEELRRLASRDAGYEVLDLGGLASEIERFAPLYKCNGCEIDIARRTGAEVATVGTVRKISNLVLIFHIYVMDVGSGRLAKVHRVDVRGNTDETWLRAVRRLVAPCPWMKLERGLPSASFGAQPANSVCSLRGNAA